MSRVVVVAGLSALLVAGLCSGALAQRATVCSITVNSEDEREAFRRHLPADRYEFVELVERGRPDWLATACRQGVRCDVLVISGHYDGGNEFFSDRLEASEYLPVDEMERVSCSDSCPGLFSQLKEVYLFGCNTLNAEPLRSASAEIGRSLVRAGHSKAEAARLSRALGARHGESSRDRMRLVFPGVPVIVSCEPNQRTLVRPVVMNGATISQIECVAADPQAAAYAQAVAQPGPAGSSYAAQPVDRDLAPAQIVPVQRTTSVARPIRTRQVVYDDPVEIKKKRSVKKSVAIIGGSAAAGAGIGALAKGKKGALIGAAIAGGGAAIWDQITRR